MPELPEVETIRRQLAPLVVGRKLESLEVLDPRWSHPIGGEALARALEGRRLESLCRRGKYLVWELDGEAFLVQHLRMTGVWLYGAPAGSRHGRVRMRFAGTQSLLAVDPRRFGTGQLVHGRTALGEFFDARLGLEPLEEAFTAAHLRRVLRGRTAPIKAVLLDQRRLAGVGNIYADEALFRSGVHPERPAGRLSLGACERLRAGLIEALEAGIDACGASIDDFRHVDGARGSFQERFLVHRRAGEPCPRCATPIVKRRVAGRGTYVCERCQPRPRRSSRRRSGPVPAQRRPRPPRRPRVHSESSTQPRSRRDARPVPAQAQTQAEAPSSSSRRPPSSASTLSSRPPTS